MIASIRAPFSLLLLLLPSQIPDQPAETARFASALAASGLACEKSSSGLSFKFTREHDGGRAQTVFVSSECSRPGELVTRSVYTTVWIDTRAAPDEALMRKVLAKSKKLGSFYLFTEKSGAWSIRFGTDLDLTDLPAESRSGDRLVQRLRDTIDFVDQVGEETDAELNGTKDIR